MVGMVPTFPLTHKYIFISLNPCPTRGRLRVQSGRTRRRRRSEGRGGADAPAPAGAARPRRAQRQGPHAHPGAKPAAHQPASEAAGRGRAGRARAGRQLGLFPPGRGRPGGEVARESSSSSTGPIRCSRATARRADALQRSARRRRRPISKRMRPTGTASAPCTWPKPTSRRRSSEALGPGPFDLLVDLGTGTGRMLELFGPRFRRGLGLDLNNAMLAYARTKLERAGLAHAQVRQGDIYDLPLADRTRRRGGHAPGAALPVRPAARHPRGRAGAGAGRPPADRRFRAARAGVPARGVRARAPGLRRRADRRTG